MIKLRNALSLMAKVLWFRQGAVRRPWFGPYRGICFVITPQLQTRMVIFRAAYEPQVTDFLRRAVLPNTVLLDVRAHVGIHALFMARLLRGRGAVYAFEAWPENFVTLQENVKANPQLAKQLVLVPLAVGSQCGKARVVKGTTDGRHHLGHGNGEMSVCMTPLDRFTSYERVCPSLVLVDMEGAELDVL